jgi:hypothetical protein
MAGFGSLAPDSSADDELMNRYYDPGTGLPVGGTDRYEPPKPRRMWMMEPDLLGTQTGQLPAGVTTDETGRPVYEDTGEPLTVVRRPGVLPFAKTPEGVTMVKPKLADLYSYVIGGPVEGAAGETALGAGMAKVIKAKKPTVKPELPPEQPETPAAKPTMARVAAARPAAPETAPPEAPPSEAPSPAQTPSARSYTPTAGVSGVVSAGVDAPPNLRVQTVGEPRRMMYPGIYANPREIAAQAAAQVGPEDPAMQRLFGVTRGDLWEMAQDRRGNALPAVPPGGPRARGSAAALQVMTPQNTQRLQDILAEAGKHEGLRGADAWYIMDPVYERMAQLHGPTEAIPRYNRFNTLTGMASPGSDVMTEIQRGTAAHWLASQGRFEDFLRYAGVPEEQRGSAAFPEDMMYIGGHPYHMTAQGGPMAKYLAAGSIQSNAPKVPLYVGASGVPETGFQTQGQVGDAHWSRGVGLTDVRKGPTDVQGSFSTPEYQTTQPWWQHQVAEPLGLESVPAQARLWTALGPQTGVESALGAPKLELLSKQIMTAANRLGISPEKARDLILSGKAGAGLLAGTVGAGAAFGSLMPQDQRQ